MEPEFTSEDFALWVVVVDISQFPEEPVNVL